LSEQRRDANHPEFTLGYVGCTDTTFEHLNYGRQSSDYPQAQQNQ
jgi:hypothetical protein